MGMAALRWGVLGPGRIAPRVVAAVGRSDRGRVEAVASRDPRRAAGFARAHGIARSFGAYGELLADPDVDVVYVALPNHLHAEWTVRALAAGKHVLCEKPMALWPEDVDRIADAAERAGRLAVEGFMYLHHPQVGRALALVGDGSLGPLELVHGSFTFFLTHEGDPRLDPAMGGGSLWDVGCYPVSLARWIAGEEPDRSAGWARFDTRGVDRTFVGQLHFGGGLLAQFDSGFAAPDRQRVEIVGQAATLVLEAPFLPAPFGPPASLTLWRGTTPTVIEVPDADPYGSEVEDLTAAILDGMAPRIALDFSRGNVATLAELDRLARLAAGLSPRATGD